MESESVLHVEVARNPRSTLKRSDVRDLVKEALRDVENPIKDFSIEDSKHSHLKEHVRSIKFCSIASTWTSSDRDILEVEKLKIHNGYKSYYNLEVHLFELNEDGENAEFMDDEEENGQSPASHHWILPSLEFHSLWDSLIFESDVKTRLLDYIETAILYSEKNVNDSLISWNKVILLHGPPGTGKTSLCKALAQKATIRLGSRYLYGQLIEINSHSLFSKWFSESGKLVMKMFEKIQELIEDPKSLVFLLIDEVESLAKCRLSAESGNEPADSVRAVNALLTQIDRIKKYPNVMVLTTSNVVNSIDLAFVDRADLKIFIGNPPADVIYGILASSINELIRVGIVTTEKKTTYFPETNGSIESSDLMYESVQKLTHIAKMSVNLSGRTLRKIPFLTHVNFVRRVKCTLYDFLEAMEKCIDTEKLELSSLKTSSKPALSMESHV